MNMLFIFTVFALLILLCFTLLKGKALASDKLRVIATTDGEIDDRCSMIRFLLYANEWGIEGLIYSSSKHHWKGDAEHPGKNWHNTTWIEEQIEKYAQIYSNLKKHDPGYPSPDYLKSQVFVGNIALEGDMREETPGSERIAEVLLDDDPSPVWLQALSATEVQDYMNSGFEAVAGITAVDASGKLAATWGEIRATR